MNSLKVAINIFPLKSGHKGRGIGYYANHLIAGLKKDPSVEILEVLSLQEASGADVLHYPWFDLFFHTLPLKKKMPTVVTIHDVIPLIFAEHYPVGIRGRINFMLQKIALKSAKYIITDSEASKADIIKYLKIENRKIAVIPLAADPRFRVLGSDTRLLYIKRQYHLPDQFLLYVGDANWVKNLPFLIEGFRQLQKSPGFEDLKLVLVGGMFLKNVEDIDHPELQSLKSVNSLIKQYGLENSIIRPGQVEDEDLVAFYNLAAVYVQTSFYEGFGLPLLQAFACGTPVISSGKGSLVEVGGQAAVYFDPSNIKQFLEVTKELLQNRSLRDKLSRLGLDRANKFSWEKTADETKQIYIKAAENE